VPPGQLDDRVHVADQSGLVHADDRAGAIGDAWRDRVDADVGAAWLGVGEDRNVVLLDQTHHGAIVGDPTHDHLVTGADGPALVRRRHGRGQQPVSPGINGHLHLPALRTALARHVGAETVTEDCNDQHVSAA